MKELTIQDLFNELYSNENLKTYLKLDNDIIELNFHKDFNVSIVLENVGFEVQINKIYHYCIESQDIVESIEELASDEMAIIQYHKPKGIYKLNL